jgi:hypothetical protein
MWINAGGGQGVYVIVMKIDTDRAIQLFGSEWVGVAILIATLAIGFYVILKAAGALWQTARVLAKASSSCRWSPLRNSSGSLAMLLAILCLLQRFAFRLKI